MFDSMWGKMEGRVKDYKLGNWVNYGIINERRDRKDMREHNFIWDMLSLRCSKPIHVEKLRVSLEGGIHILQRKDKRFGLDLIMDT